MSLGVSHPVSILPGRWEGWARSRHVHPTLPRSLRRRRQQQLSRWKRACGTSLQDQVRHLQG